MMSENTTKDKAKVSGLPTIKYFRTTYGMNIQAVEKPALKDFFYFETQEKKQRLRTELIWVKDSKVPTGVCAAAINPKVLATHKSYEKWASLMLVWIAEIK